MIKLQLEYFPAINYSLINNRITVVQSIEITNDSTEDVRNIVIECTGEFFQDTRSHIIDILKSGQSMRLQGVELMPVPTKVASITEKVLTLFTVKVVVDAQSANKQILTSEDFKIEIMPYDQWLGTSILPQSLVSFVMPNTPMINSLVVKAAAKLKEISQSSAFTEYQSGNTNEVRKQIAAVYGALHAENIVYRSLPASYEVVGQRITLPDQVLTTKLGNCIELTLLFASILESIGINSGIVLQKGHAYLAVWLVDDCCPYSIYDDAAYIEKKCAEGIDEMLVLECTQVTSEKTSFEEAQRIAVKNLADTSLFEMFIDIRRCRLERILPLPQRIQHDGVWEIPTEGVSHDECLLNIKEHSRYDLTQLMDSKQEVTKMDIWERKLLDFSLRNSMLNLYLRQKAIQFISFDVNLIEDHLQEGEEYAIAPKPNMDIKLTEKERLIRSKLLPELHTLVTNDIQHHILHTYLTELETCHILKNIYRASRNALEETGANALYLTIGALRWYETDLSEKARYAPILMLPVEMVYKKGNYYIRTRDEEIALNITLIEFLRQNFGIHIPGLSPLPTDAHGVDVSKIFAIIREVLKNKKRWDVEEESILGVFSFNKFLMWNDLHNHREELWQNDIVRSLIEQKLTFTPQAVTTNLKEIDKTLRPDALSLPVPVDSSQMAAVIKAGKGHSFILYGPPGTGKSQTITNLIANALFQGKRVLFVAEKMAALSVVQKRLEKIGLAPFCLEMHSNKLTKRHVLDQLKMALEVTHIVKPEEYTRMADQLFEQRSKLIAYMEALHDVKGPEGMSLYDCIVRYSSIEAPLLDIDAKDEDLRKHFRIEELDNYRHLLSDKYRAILHLIGHPSENPLLGLQVEEEDLADTRRLASRMKEALTLLENGHSRRAQLSRAEILKKEILRDCNPQVLSANAEELYREWKTVRAKWFLPRFFAKRNYLNKLRQFNPLVIEPDIDAFLAKLMEYQELHSDIAHIQEALRSFFDLPCAEDVLPAEPQMNTCMTKLSTWQHHLDNLHDWYQWCAYKQELIHNGLGVLCEKLESTALPAETLYDSFLKTLCKHLANEKIAQSSTLRTFEGTLFDETVTRYQKLTEEFQLLSQKELYARLAARIPHVTDSIDHSSEIGFLNRNISSGGRGVSLRDLLDQIPTLLPRLCPCMLMSPMSVAQFLDLSQDKFDLVVFDEASQMPTSEAVGAIARGKAIVVVGDPKQMPPTSFFSSTSTSEEEADLDDMESILEDCRTLSLPSLQLNWHYRSKHESLIAFSNNEYYEGSLITFPSVDDQSTKVQYHYVDGIYDKGGQRSNRKEAEAIVGEIARRLALPDHATRSIGVIAFNIVQQNLIEDLLMELLDQHKELREAAEEIYEPIFIKNLENVQGDERDVILFSIGYGPDKEGKVSMNFGPLNNAGGERRLNVAVSRARREMWVYTSLKASQIDLKRSKARGVEGLKHFLEYAEQQILVQPRQIKHETADTVIADQIAAALRERGHQVNTHIGRSNFKVDVALCDPESNGNYALGILLDGKNYHDTQTTRDREIVQPTVLKMLNWKVMRVWSVDWIHHPERVIAHIEACLKEKPIETTPFFKATFDISKEATVEIKSEVKEYKFYPANKKTEFLTDKELARNILSYEQPMTIGYLCRRIGALRGMSRVSSNMLATVTEMARHSFYTQPMGNTTVVWNSKENAETFEGYRSHNGRDISEIPQIEVTNALTESVREQVSIKTDALTLIVAKKLGFTRRGKKVDQALNEALAYLLSNHRVVEMEGMVRLPDVQK